MRCLFASSIKFERFDNCWKFQNNRLILFVKQSVTTNDEAKIRKWVSNIPTRLERKKKVTNSNLIAVKLANIVCNETKKSQRKRIIENLKFCENLVNSSRLPNHKKRFFANLQFFAHFNWNLCQRDIIPLIKKIVNYVI